MNKLTSFLTPFIEAFIFYQKASNHWNETYEANLLQFELYCKKQYPESALLTQEMVEGWCHKRDTETNNSCITRVCVIISFIRYLRKRRKTDVMVPEIPKKERRTYIPHSFTDTELQNFFLACDSLPSGQCSRKITIPVFFRLLYSSGIRTCEARKLRIEEVDLCNGILNIRCSKGQAQHFVVLHDSMLELLKIYDAAIRKQYPQRVYFFPSKNNSFHDRKWVSTNFRTLWDKHNNSHAIAYELRHHYAVENINRWTDEGFGFDAKLFYLSKSMGHSTVECTKYYYSLVPGMAEILEEKTGSDFESIVPEVDYEESDE
jgi:site-specific recombinase XerD